ncbi:MAG: hypothetical protein ACO3VC_09450 [Ilumatobacteraceae bacterium]|jgi:hypothetical protein
MDITNGRIYKCRGDIVRAIVKADNGMRVIQTASKLNGFAHDAELIRATKDEVNAFVDKVRELRLVK